MKIINLNVLARAQRARNTRNCASKFQNGQNDLLRYLAYVSDHFAHFILKCAHMIFLRVISK